MSRVSVGLTFEVVGILSARGSTLRVRGEDSGRVMAVLRRKRL